MRMQSLGPSVLLGILIAAVSSPAGALSTGLSAAVTCTDQNPVDTDGGAGVPSAQCSYQVNRGGLDSRVGTIDASSSASAGFRSVGVSGSVEAEVVTRFPVNFGATTSAQATLEDTFLMDASFPNGTPVPSGFLNVNVATSGFMDLIYSGQALLSTATLSYSLSVGAAGTGDVITIFPGDPSAVFSALLPVVIPWQQGVPLTVSMSASATVDGILTDDGSVDISVDFGNSLHWLGITEVTDSDGVPVASFSAVSGDGVDWGQVVPEPSTALLLAVGVCLLALPRGTMTRP
jgi:hypothetical protein